MFTSAKLYKLLSINDQAEMEKVVKKMSEEDAKSALVLVMTSWNKARRQSSIEQGLIVEEEEK